MERCRSRKPCQHSCSKNPFQGGTPLQSGRGVTPGFDAVASLHGLLGHEGPGPCDSPEQRGLQTGLGTHRGAEGGCSTGAVQAAAVCSRQEDIREQRCLHP